MMRSKLLACLSAGLFVLGAASPRARAESAPAPAAPQDPYDALNEKIGKNPDAASEDDLKSLLDLAKKSGRPLSASVGVRQDLKKHTTPSPQLLFAAAETLQIQLQGAQLIPSQFIEMIPYLLTIVALAGVLGRATPPAALGQVAE